MKKKDLLILMKAIIINNLVSNKFLKSSLFNTHR